MWVKHTPVLRKGSSTVFACLLQVVKVPFTGQVLSSRQYGVMHQIWAADALNVGKKTNVLMTGCLYVTQASLAVLG